MLVIYHADCLDGFGAAYAAWKKDPEATFVAAKYGDTPPDVTGQEVYILDFSYPEATLMDMVDVAQSVTILDHHKSAEKDLKPMLEAGLIQGEFDMNRSGAVMAWQYFHPDSEIPQLLKHIQDRDLWKFELPKTREICAALATVSRTFLAWNNIITPDDLYDLIISGEAILKAHNANVQAIVENAYRFKIGGYDVPVANANYMFASDVGNILCRGEPFAATWYQDGTHRYFSLRSEKGKGIDVSDIATFCGGGGHKHAAGFKVAI